MSVVDSDDLTARQELMQTLRVFLLMSDNCWMRQIPVCWNRPGDIPVRVAYLSEFWLLWRVRWPQIRQL